MAKETILRCDECNEQINNGRFNIISFVSGWYAVLKIKRNEKRKTVPEALEEGSTFEEFDICSEGCLVKFEAKLREKL